MTKTVVSRCILAYFYKLVYLKIISQIEFSNSHDVVSHEFQNFEHTRKVVHVFQSARKGREDSSIFNQHVLSSGINP